MIEHSIALLVMFSVGFVAGMYITTQLEKWIERKIHSKIKKEDKKNG